MERRHDKQEGTQLVMREATRVSNVWPRAGMGLREYLMPESVKDEHMKSGTDTQSVPVAVTPVLSAHRQATFYGHLRCSHTSGAAGCT